MEKGDLISIIAGYIRWSNFSWFGPKRNCSWLNFCVAYDSTYILSKFVDSKKTHEKSHGNIQYITSRKRKEALSINHILCRAIIVPIIAPIEMQ